MPELRVFADADELGAALAAQIREAYEAKSGPFLLGCPGGRSLRSTYRALAALDEDWRHLVVVMVDEYVPAPPDAHYSCRRFARDEIAGPLGVPDERVWIPDADGPAAFERRVAAGIDLFLLASGASDGHVAFLPPGSPLDGRTSVVEIADSTRRDNLVTYPDFRSLDEVPRYGVSVGLGTIRDSRRVRLVLHGEDKREATARVLALGGFDPSWPASVIYACRDAEIWVTRNCFSGSSQA